MATGAIDTRVRQRAFAFLADEVARHGDKLSWATLLKGFDFDGHRVPLIGPQGIFKPAILDLPLSINTAPPKPGKTPPYDDGLDAHGFLRYRYRGEDPHHRDNVGLRTAMAAHLPLVYLHGIVPGEYLAAWPTFIVGDDPGQLSFRVEVDAERLTLPNAAEADLMPPSTAEVQRSYSTVVTLRRMHQASFRERVLRAYRKCCAVCHLKHAELLEAAHILPDRHPLGRPEVPNGLALCKLHHAAFDQNIMGVRPDLRIEIRADVLDETDGPMLKHGLQEFHGRELVVPVSKVQRPNRDFLGERYDIFKKAS